MIFDPLHYLALLEQKPNALDQAAPLADWRLPEEFGGLRRLLEGRLSKRGKREFVQVLRLLETFPLTEVVTLSSRPCISARYPSTPSSICCFVVLNGGRRGWIWIAIPICRSRK